MAAIRTKKINKCILQVVLFTKSIYYLPFQLKRVVVVLKCVIHHLKIYNNKKRRNATKPGFQRFNQVLI